MPNERDVSYLADAMTRMANGQERPMDPSVQRTTQDPEQFFGPGQTGQLGPLSPPPPFPLGGDPRQFQYRPGWNLPSIPKDLRPVDPDLLRTLADSYDLLRKCIEIRKFEVASLQWDIVPREKSKKRAAEKAKELSGLINEIKQVFMYPEAYLEETPTGFVRKPIRTWQEWISALLEDHFVLDAMTIYPRPKRNGELLALERIDGATIKPLLTIDGRVPTPPAPAYQQYIYGMPRASFTLKQLYYKPRNVRNNTPYGFSHVEQALIHINLALRTQMWYSAYFTHGSIPEGLLGMPDSWTPDQMWSFIERLNETVAGNPAALRQFLPAPSGTSWIPLKEFSMNDSLISYVVTMTCAIMDIQPMELGFMPLHGGAGLGGKGWAEEQNLIHRRKSLVPLARWLEDIFTQIIHDWWGDRGGYDLEFSFNAIRDMEDYERDKNDIELIKSGVKSLDEVVMERGGEPPGVGRMFVVGSNVLFEPDLVYGSKHGAGALGLIKGGGPLPEEGNGGKTEPQADDVDRSDGLENLIRALLTKAADDDQETDDEGDDEEEDVDESDASETKEEEVDFIAWFLPWLLRMAASARRTLATGTLNYTLPVSPAVLEGLSPSEDDVQELADHIFDLRRAAYTKAINKQLSDLDLDPIDTVTDPDVLENLRRVAEQNARSILENWWRDAANHVEVLRAQGLNGKELVDALIEWMEDRAAFKAKQVAVTEAYGSFTDAYADFQERNGLYKDAQYWVVPGSAVCERCKELIRGGPYTKKQAIKIMRMLPLHPLCVHHIAVEYGRGLDEINIDNLWTGGEG